MGRSFPRLFPGSGPCYSKSAGVGKYQRYIEKEKNKGSGFVFRRGCTVDLELQETPETHLKRNLTPFPTFGSPIPRS
jgi:hypothetical protein